MADIVVNPECQDAKTLSGQGMRACVIEDFEGAVTALGKALELFQAEYKDELHESLGEVYLYYGKSLLGLSRNDNEPLGDAVPKNTVSDDEDGDDEADPAPEQEEDSTSKTEETTPQNGEVSTSTEKQQTTAATATEKVVNGEASREEDTKEDSSKPSSSSSAENGEAAGPSMENQGEDEEPTDLQLAWEVLELAKKIFENKDDKKSLADTLIVLGEVSLENANFEQAINDIKEGLKLQQELFSDDSRTVAETLYKLGMAYSTSSFFQEAIDNFESAKKSLRKRVKVLEEKKPQSQEDKEEIEEINALIPDIDEKIADVVVYKEEALAKVAEAIKEPVPKKVQDGASGSSKQASDISHLVKRKRKLEDIEEKAEAEETPSKKVAT